MSELNSHAYDNDQAMLDLHDGLKDGLSRERLVGSTAFDDLVKIMNCTVTLAKRWSMALY